MNRGIFLSIPEPDEGDLIKTSIYIAESINKSLTSQNEDIFNQLSSTYYEYINELKNNIDKADFHGARDFYNLIKITIKMLTDKFPKEYNKVDENIKQNVALISIERNLAGLKFDTVPETTSLKKVKSIFNK